MFLALTLAACSGDKSGDRDSSGGSTSSSGGSTGTGGMTTMSGGSGGGGPLNPYPCDPKAPDTAEMTKTITADGKWGGTGFSGGTFTYGDGSDADMATDVKMTFSVADGSLHIVGNVSTYTGFGLWFAPVMGQKYTCIDASAYTGVSYNIVDNAGTAASMLFSIQAHGDSPVDVANTRGGCVYSDPSKKYSECVYPSTSVPVPSGGGDVEVPFMAFMNGKPEATVNPAELDGLQWQFPWMDGMAAYDVDITIKDLKFYGP